MPRRPRIKLAGVPQHIVQRGINREPCFFADAGDEVWIGNRRVAPLLEGAHLAHDAIRFRFQDGPGTGRTEVTRHRRYDGDLTPLGVGQLAGLVDQFSCAAHRTFHVHSFLKDTISTSLMTVSLA
jgi:hypothetical protein